MPNNHHPLRLEPEQLYRRCSLSHFDFQTTSEIGAQQTIYGQHRGTTAIEFGIDIQQSGYNIYVLGPSGSGRLTAVERFINERARDAATPDDWCYVYDFKNTHKATALRLPAGQGCLVKADMEKLIATLKDEIPQIFESEDYLKAQSEIKTQFERQHQAILGQVQQLAADKSFALQTTQQGAIVILPLLEGKPIPPEEFSKLPEETQTQFNMDRRELEDAIEAAFRQSRDLQRDAEHALETLRRDLARQVVEAHMAEIMKRYDTSGAVIQYLWAVRDDILDELDRFESDDAESTDESDDGLMPGRGSKIDFFRRYEVNVFVEHEPDTGAPVILLDLPSYQNLIGRIEHEVKFGMLTTDFMQIVSGALHRANGGFLILRSADILQQPLAWDALKRTLSSGQVVLEDTQSQGMSVMATQHLEPEPIPVDLKVVMVGSPQIYYTLHALDEDFRDLFRVKADFVDAMERSRDNEYHYAIFLATICHNEGLTHFDVGAVGRIIDYGSWLISDQQRLSATFGQITPLIYESVFFARRNGHAFVTVDDVEQALNARTYRNNETEELSHERITDGTIFLDFEGAVVGQINGLVVINSGDHVFGLPSRLTARVFMSRREDVVQIDRESLLTGPIHDKGVLILQGYLGGHYAQGYPLALTASLTFEQSYGMVEGDSASGAELFALLSALADLPIRQDIGVTGSVNQRGQIQPVGGVTQKIEGFYKACKDRGLTGTQGVIIPKANIRNLMLDDEVVQAVHNEQFHIYAIETVDDGIALLTGKDAGQVHQMVDARLRQFAEALALFDKR